MEAEGQAPPCGHGFWSPCLCKDHFRQSGAAVWRSTRYRDKAWQVCRLRSVLAHSTVSHVLEGVAHASQAQRGDVSQLGTLHIQHREASSQVSVSV